MQLDESTLTTCRKKVAVPSACPSSIKARTEVILGKRIGRLDASRSIRDSELCDITGTNVRRLRTISRRLITNDNFTAFKAVSEEARDEALFR